MHCPCNVTHIAGGVDAGHCNGKGKDAKFRSPAGIVFVDKKLYVCDSGNGAFRVIDLFSLFCHPSKISSEDDGDSDSENTDCATRRVRSVQVHDLLIRCEMEFEGLLSPVAICSSTTNVLYTSDIHLRKVFSLSQIYKDEDGFKGHLEELYSFNNSGLPTALTCMLDGEYLLVGNCDKELGTGVTVVNIASRTIVKTLAVKSPTGLKVTSNEQLFVVSSEKHCVYEYRVDELLKGPVAGTKYGNVSRHRDGVDNCWSNLSGICSFRNTVFASDTGNKAMRLITLPKALVPLQKVMSSYAVLFGIDKKTKDTSERTFEESIKYVCEVVRFFDNHEEQAFEQTGRRSMNGPDMTVSRTTRQSFTVCLDALTKLSNVLNEIGKESLL